MHLSVIEFLLTRLTLVYHLDIDRYQSKVNKSAISIQRINECDERKQTNYVNRAIIKSNNNIDHTVFVSSWLKGVYEKSGIKLKSSSVVLGGSDSNIIDYTISI